MSEGATKLNYDDQDAPTSEWDDIESHWKDAVRADFEAKHLDPLITQVSATIRGMNQARRDHPQDAPGLLVNGPRSSPDRRPDVVSRISTENAPGRPSVPCPSRR